MADIRRLPTPVAEVWDWQLHGACRGENTSLFFHPDGERGPARARRQNAAKAVCARCPVIDACLKHALSVREPYGVWGGMSEEERARLIAADPAAVAVGVCLLPHTPKRAGPAAAGPALFVCSAGELSLSGCGRARRASGRGCAAHRRGCA